MPEMVVIDQGVDHMHAVSSRRFVIRERGGPDALELITETTPEPGMGQVRIRSLASGVSAHDAMLRSSSFPGFPKVPFTPGVDVVGIVDAVGEGVTSVEIGQRVAGLLTADGGYSESVCFDSDFAVPVPDGLDPAVAVAVVANYGTASTMLHRGASIQAGERILVHGAAGGVGTAILQLGGLIGLDMYGTASAPNHDLVRSLGATPIDYHSEDFVARIAELTGDGVDAVFDPIGGFRQLRRSYRTLRRGGRLNWFGVAAATRNGTARTIVGSLAAKALLSLIPDGKRAPMPPNFGKPIEVYRATLAELLDMAASGTIDPTVTRVPFTQAVQAHEALETGGYAGKFVLVMEGSSG